jgi:hypothetical protein
MLFFIAWFGIACIVAIIFGAFARAHEEPSKHTEPKPEQTKPVFSE